jgi:ribokinase
MSVDLVVAVPAFMDITFVGLEALPQLGEERFAGDMMRAPGGGGISAVGCARLGLSTALAAPIGTDRAGEIVRERLLEENVAIIGTPCPRTPISMVMPVDGSKAIVSFDPGVRARASEVAAPEPEAVLVSLGQLDVVPEGVRAYVTAGDDDARAFAGRPPAGLERAAGLLVDTREGMVLTGEDTPEKAAAALGERVGAVVVGAGPGGGAAYLNGKPVRIDGFDCGPIVDASGTSDLFASAWIWADHVGLPLEEGLRWASLYSSLCVRFPSAIGGAARLDELLAEGAKRGLTAP